MSNCMNHIEISDQLFDALTNKQPISPISDIYPDMSIDDAYQISLAFLKRRLEESGEKVIGKKIGATSKVIQDLLGLDQPDFGFITDAWLFEDNKVPMDNHIAPMVEAELAFKLKKNLKGPGVTPEDVIEATEYVQPCFEIVDSRIKDWKIKIGDTIADNASFGSLVLGEEKVDPRGIDLKALEFVVEKNGQEISRGLGEAVYGSPERSVAWLANILGEFDITLEAGEIILSGAPVPFERVSKGDHVRSTIKGLGSCSVEFV